MEEESLAKKGKKPMSKKENKNRHIYKTLMCGYILNSGGKGLLKRAN